MSLPAQRKRFGKRALVFAAAAMLALGAGTAALRLQAARAAGPDHVARALEQRFGLRARVGGAELDAWGLCLSVREVALDGQHGPVLRAKSLRIRPSLAALLGGRVDLRSLELEGAVLSLREGDVPPGVRGETGDFPFESLSARNARLSFESAALGRLALERADLELSARGRLLRIALRSPAGELVRGGTREALSGMRVQAAFEPGVLRISRLAAQGKGARVQMRNARVPWPYAAQAEAEVELEADLARLSALGLLGVAPAVEGQIHARGRVAFAGPRVRGEGQVVLEGASAAGRALGERVELGVRADEHGTRVSGALPLGAAATPIWFSAALRSQPERLAFEALTVKVGNSELRGRAELEREGAMALELAGDDVAIAELAPLFGDALAAAELRGRGRVALQMRGPLSSPEPRIELALKAFGVAGTPLGDLNAALRVQAQGHTLRVERALLSSAARRLSAQDWVLHLDGGVAGANARVKIERLPLADLYVLLGAERDPVLSRLQGQARGHAEIELSARDGERLDLDLELTDATLGDYRFDGGRLRARFAAPADTRSKASERPLNRLAKGALTLHELVLRSGKGTLTLGGEIRSGGALDLELALERLRFERLPWMRAHLPQLEGSLAGTGRLHGTSTDPRAQLDLAGESVRFGAARLGELRLRAELRGSADADAGAIAPACRAGRDALAARALGKGPAWLLCGEAMGGRVRVDLVAGTAAGFPVRGAIALDRFDLAPFLPERHPGKRVRGELDASLRIAQGALSSPEQISGALAVSKLAFGEGALSFASSAPFEIAITRGELSLAGAELAADQAKLALTASGSLKRGMKLEARGQAKPSLLANVLPFARDVFGELDVQVALDSRRQPAVHGQLELQHGIVQLESGAFVREVTGKLAFDGERVRVEAARGEIGGGELRADGVLELSGLRVAGYDLDLVVERIAIEPQERLEVAFDARAKLKSESRAPPRLSGRVQLHRLVYGRHIQLPEALIALNRDERANQAAYDPARDRIRFDLEIAHTAPVVIRNNFLDVEVAAAPPSRVLHLTGSDQRFGLVGKLEVLRGRVLYRGDEFRVTRGAIAFEDERRIAPSFDLRAVAEGKKRPDASILFSARGDRDAFGIRITCQANSATPPPFTCDFAQNRFRCDSFDELVKLWVCRAGERLSSAP